MRRYLLVDDNRALAENLSEILRDEGAEVTIACDGAEALELLRMTKFDAVVTDMRMPVMSGSMLIKALRVVDPGLPVVIMTAYTAESELADARHAGIFAVLPKPVPIEQLVSLLSTARRNAMVAIVEDDLQLSDNLSDALRERGFTVLAASSAIEAEQVTALRPFTALVDLNLPGTAMGQLLRLMTARSPALPVLVMTGFPEAMPPVVTEGVFGKPFNTERLLAAVEAIYARSELGASNSTQPEVL